MKTLLNDVLFKLCNTKDYELRPVIGKPLYKLAQWLYKKGW